MNLIIDIPVKVVARLHDGDASAEDKEEIIKAVRSGIGVGLYVMYAQKDLELQLKKRRQRDEMDAE